MIRIQRLSGRYVAPGEILIFILVIFPLSYDYSWEYKIMEPIVESALNQYFKSGDFNGLPIRTLFQSDADRELVRIKLGELLKQELITLEFGYFHPNPHIKAFPVDPMHEATKKALAEDDFAHACVYPSPKVLKEHVSESDGIGKPFTRRLMLGEPQLMHHAFDLSILEFYRNEPRYHYEANDINGWISIRGEPGEDEYDGMNESDQVFLQTFGFGYDQDMTRAVVVFNRYLHDLSAEHQQIWNSKLLPDRFRLHPDYYRNSILGDWGVKISIFEAFAQELKCINDLALLIGRPPLFRNDFSIRPRNFSFLIRPTTKEFNDFVLLLDQMMSDNINKKFFGDDISYEDEEERSDGKIVVRPKGTIRMLEEWFLKEMRFTDSKPFEDMIKKFKNVRKLRQKPAHKPEDSKFDQKLFTEQRDLICDAYGAIRIIRLMLVNHPATKDYKVPELLYKAEIWTF